MRILQALGVMALWNIAIIGLLNFVNFDEHYREPLWALGAALILIIMIIGNFWIFFAIAKEEPWDWVKNKESSGDE
jgi:hypothetical protein